MFRPYITENEHFVSAGKQQEMPTDNVGVGIQGEECIESYIVLQGRVQKYHIQLEEFD